MENLDSDSHGAEASCKTQQAASSNTRTPLKEKVFRSSPSTYYWNPVHMVYQVSTQAQADAASHRDQSVVSEPDMTTTARALERRSCTYVR